MDNKIMIRLKRANDWFCRFFLKRCGYCDGRIYQLPSGVTVCQVCRKRH